MIPTFIKGILSEGVNHWRRRREKEEQIETEQRQQQYIKEQMGLNFQYNELAAKNADMRQRQQYNDLYSFQAQKAQMKAAGLSPGLMYSGGGAGGGSSANGNMSQGASGMDPANAINASLNFAQIEQMKAQTELIKAQKSKTDEETKTEADTRQGKIEIQTATIENIKANTSNQTAITLLTELQSTYQKMQNNITKETMPTLIQQATANLNKTLAETDLTRQQEQMLIQEWQNNQIAFLLQNLKTQAEIQLTQTQEEHLRKNMIDNWQSMLMNGNLDDAFYNLKHDVLDNTIGTATKDIWNDIKTWVSSIKESVNQSPFLKKLIKYMGEYKPDNKIFN